METVGAKTQPPSSLQAQLSPALRRLLTCFMQQGYRGAKRVVQTPGAQNSLGATQMSQVKGLWVRPSVLSLSYADFLWHELADRGEPGVHLWTVVCSLNGGLFTSAVEKTVVTGSWSSPPYLPPSSASFTARSLFPSNSKKNAALLKWTRVFTPPII